MHCRRDGKRLSSNQRARVCAVNHAVNVDTTYVRGNQQATRNNAARGVYHKLRHIKLVVLALLIVRMR